MHASLNQMMKSRGSYQHPRKKQNNLPVVDGIESHLIMAMEEDPLQNHDNNGEAVGDETTTAVAVAVAIATATPTNNEGIVDNKTGNHPVPRML